MVGMTRMIIGATLVAIAAGCGSIASTTRIGKVHDMRLGWRLTPSNVLVEYLRGPIQRRSKKCVGLNRQGAKAAVALPENLRTLLESKEVLCDRDRAATIDLASQALNVLPAVPDTTPRERP